MISPSTNSKRSSLRGLCVLCVSALSFLLVLYAESSSKVHAKQEAVSSSRPVPGRSRSQIVRLHLPATLQPTSRRCIPRKPFSSAAPIATAAMLQSLLPASTAPNSTRYKAAKEKAHVQPRDASFKDRSALPERTYTKWLARVSRVHQVCESWRPARRAGNLRSRWLPRQGSSRCLDEHDDAHRIAMGRRAL